MKEWLAGWGLMTHFHPGVEVSPKQTRCGEKQGLGEERREKKATEEIKTPTSNVGVTYGNPPKKPKTHHRP